MHIMTLKWIFILKSTVVLLLLNEDSRCLSVCLVFVFAFLNDICNILALLHHEQLARSRPNISAIKAEKDAAWLGWFRQQVRDRWRGITCHCDLWSLCQSCFNIANIVCFQTLSQERKQKKLSHLIYFIVYIIHLRHPLMIRSTKTLLNILYTWAIESLMDQTFFPFSVGCLWWQDVWKQVKCLCLLF